MPRLFFENKSSDISRLMFLFRFLLRPYDVTISAFCPFVHAISTEVRVRLHFSLLVERVFFCVIKFLVTPDLPHSQKGLLDFEIDFSLL